MVYGSRGTPGASRCRRKRNYASRGATAAQRQAVNTSATSALIAPTAPAFTTTANAPIAAPEPSAGTIESKPERCQKHSYAKAPLRNSVEIAAAELMMAIRVVVTSR